jgi:DNA-binding transcriptional MerR regulator
MASYSIKDLEHLSGVKAHTIRIWEQRYNIIEPERTNTNIRTYNDNDLRKLLNVSLLNDYGYKISRIALLSNDALHEEVKKVTNVSDNADNQLAALTVSMIELNEEQFEKILANNILRLGFEKTMITIIFPFLERIGFLWITGAISPAQEHFVSNMVRQKLIVAIDGQMVTHNSANDTFMLFAPEGEQHEIGLLFMSYLIRSRKRKVLYLGANVPFADLDIIYKIHSPKYLFCFVTATPTGDALQQYVTDLSKTFPNCEIWLAGSQFSRHSLTFGKNVTLLANLSEAQAKLDAIRAAEFVQ